MSKSNYIKDWDDFFEKKEKECGDPDARIRIDRDLFCYTIKKIYVHLKDIHSCMSNYDCEEAEKIHLDVAKLQYHINSLAEHHCILDYFITKDMNGELGD